MHADMPQYNALTCMHTCTYVHTMCYVCMYVVGGYKDMYSNIGMYTVHISNKKLYEVL